MLVSCASCRITGISKHHPSPPRPTTHNQTFEDFEYNPDPHQATLVATKNELLTVYVSERYTFSNQGEGSCSKEPKRQPTQTLSPSAMVRSLHTESSRDRHCQVKSHSMPFFQSALFQILYEISVPTICCTTSSTPRVRCIALDVTVGWGRIVRRTWL